MDHVCKFDTFRTMQRKGEDTAVIVGECSVGGHTAVMSVEPAEGAPTMVGVR